MPLTFDYHAMKLEEQAKAKAKNVKRLEAEAGKKKAEASPLQRVKLAVSPNKELTQAKREAARSKELSDNTNEALR
ncbi:hypothetical protein B7494_g7558 [Chlorociboria aeruginascens]|nr:hypothetical protein B7494_g7558 [Chlorociboria aeruginascens]